MNQNPLSKFFRQPAIYVRLPSNGQGWTEGSLDLPVNQELPVLPMTAIDEITYRTPDALFNGEAVAAVIHSCIPNIKDAWGMPNIDVDALLVAIRIASFGHNIDIDTKCPECKETHTFEIDLRSVLDRLGYADYTKTLVIGDLTFAFRPLSYRQVTENSLEQFEYQKTLQSINASEQLDDKDKLSQLNKMMHNLLAVTVKALACSISEVRTAGTVVTETQLIEEFLNNCDRNLFNRVKEHVVELRKQSEIRPLSIECPNCNHTYEQVFTLDMSNFFGSAS